LGAIEASLVGPATVAAADAGKAADGAATPAKPAKAGPAASATSDAAKAAREASEDTHGGGKADWDTGHQDRVVIGGKAVVVGDGDHANINLPGLHVEADDKNAKVNIGGIHIDASDDQATVHVTRDVRLRGESFSREKRGLRVTFIAKRDNLPDGYHFVGYEASGPKTGPLTVAIVKSRDEITDGNRLYHDIQRLVRRNGGA
jgi:pyruvate/2-oxoglutarate dehydrogenase complex dihydrolipoamide acyltransferase (E2) component